MRIEAKAALTLAALIRSDLAAIARIESHVSQLDLNTLSPAELLPEQVRSVVSELLGFVMYFDMHTTTNLTQP